MVSLTTIAIATIILAIFYYFKNKKENYPPGPIPIPILGNILSLDRRPHLTHHKWAKQYGPIFSYQMGSHNAVVISDYKLIKEALNNNAFSGRPDIHLFNTLGRYGITATECQASIEQRRFVLRNLRDFGIGKMPMETLLMEEVKDVISWLKKNEGKPVSVQNKLNLSVINALWHILSGQRFDPEDNQLLEMLEAAERVTNSSVLRILFPKFAEAFPNISGYSEFAKLVNEFLKIPDGAIKDHEINPAEDEQPRDFIDAYLNEINKTTNPNSSFYKQTGKRHLQAALTDLFGAGSVTTSDTISWTVLYMIRHPEVQKKFQQEIDQVIGKSRFPVLADKAKMPYTEAMINEVLRLSSLLPSSLFHTIVEDVEFHGYKLPKGTLIIPNVYSVHQDKQIWGDPENFRPERFLSADGKVFIRNEAVLAFSTGKRVCIGENLARDELFLFLTSIFQKFNVFADPENPKPTMEPIEGQFCIPEPFKIVIKERF